MAVVYGRNGEGGSVRLAGLKFRGPEAAATPAEEGCAAAERTGAEGGWPRAGRSILSRGRGRGEDREEQGRDAAVARAKERTRDRRRYIATVGAEARNSPEIYSYSGGIGRHDGDKDDESAAEIRRGMGRNREVEKREDADEKERRTNLLILENSQSKRANIARGDVTGDDFVTSAYFFSHDHPGSGFQRVGSTDIYVGLINR